MTTVPMSTFRHPTLTRKMIFLAKVCMLINLFLEIKLLFCLLAILKLLLYVSDGNSKQNCSKKRSITCEREDAQLIDFSYDEDDVPLGEGGA